MDPNSMIDPYRPKPEVLPQTCPPHPPVSPEAVLFVGGVSIVTMFFAIHPEAGLFSMWILVVVQFLVGFVAHVLIEPELNQLAIDEREVYKRMLSRCAVKSTACIVTASVLTWAVCSLGVW